MNVENSQMLTVLAELERKGCRLIAHLAYDRLTEKVQLHVADWLSRCLETEYNVISPVPAVRELLQKVNVYITFYQKEVSNLITEKKEMVKLFYLHDTADKQLANALGASLADLHNKVLFNQPIPEA